MRFSAYLQRLITTSAWRRRSNAHAQPSTPVSDFVEVYILRGRTAHRVALFTFRGWSASTPIFQTYCLTLLALQEALTASKGATASIDIPYGVRMTSTQISVKGDASLDPLNSLLSSNNKSEIL